MGSGLGSKFTMRVNKFKYDSLELLHNAINEKKEREKGVVNAAIEERDEPLRIVGQFAEYAV
ncbi:hypothetical protein Avbf_09679 [Armadillidium vulgare]|nr:hypothetical protein Avbf_09679 [Armadillidium vulgare]